MILFVFEGGKAEPMVFDSIGELFLSKEELCVLKCEHDLPTLYSNLRANEYDLFRSLPFKENYCCPLKVSEQRDIHPQCCCNGIADDFSEGKPLS